MRRIFLNYFLFVFGVLLILQFGLGPLTSRFLASYMKEDTTRYYRELTRGLFHVMIADLQRENPNGWSGHIQTLQVNFGFPIALQQLDTMRLSAAEMDQLAHGLIVVQGEGDMFYKRIVQSPYVLQMGPFKALENQIVLKFNVLLWTSLVVLISLLTLIWAFPFWRKLNRIRTAAMVFGNGDLSARVQLSRRSSLVTIADAFNRMAERIQQLIDAHRELTRAVSHELRTPLARIRFSLELLVRAEKAEDRRRGMEGIQKDIDELEQLIAELLTYARFDGQPPQLEQRCYPIVPWLHETAAYMSPELERVQFNLRVSENAVHLVARFEPRHMGRAVINLLRNATCYARGQIDLIIESQAEQVVVHVDDDGPGIPAADRERIFEPFTRLDESRDRGSGGFGLGLAIVRRVAEWHGGRAWASQSPLGGARFTIQWPGGPKEAKVKKNYL